MYGTVPISWQTVMRCIAGADFVTAGKLVTCLCLLRWRFARAGWIYADLWTFTYPISTLSDPFRSEVYPFVLQSILIVRQY